jgi:transcriptional regulator with XRE-family HTH domain
MEDTICVFIRFQREQRAWTHEQLAETSGTDVRTIQRAEHGTKLSADSLQAIAGAFDLTVDQLRKAPKPIADAMERLKLIWLTQNVRPMYGTSCQSVRVS